ncbi:hypothetical protein [Nocardia thailandica]|uniref:hypothetical protein n=1 Tax=Nocardia thailandica TaxID=257275 RepID=UPI00031C9D3E|nr:hypothetical protein [Nocardia thailandica]
MEEHAFSITPAQWSRFVEIVNSTLAELLTVGLLNGATDEVTLIGGKRKDDLRCRIDDLDFTVEVKTAWWHDAERTTVGHAPLRPTQQADLVALVGKFDVDEAEPTLKRLRADELTIAADRMFYLMPESVVSEHSRPDRKSTARSLIPADVVHPYAVDLEQGVDRERVLELLEG